MATPERTGGDERARAQGAQQPRQLYAPKALVLLSHYPFYNLYTQFLQQVRRAAHHPLAGGLLDTGAPDTRRRGRWDALCLLPWYLPALLVYLLELTRDVVELPRQQQLQQQRCVSLAFLPPLALTLRRGHGQ